MPAASTRPRSVARSTPDRITSEMGRSSRRLIALDTKCRPVPSITVIRRKLRLPIPDNVPVQDLFLQPRRPKEPRSVTPDEHKHPSQSSSLINHRFHHLFELWTGH